MGEFKVGDYVVFNRNFKDDCLLKIIDATLSYRAGKHSGYLVARRIDGFGGEFLTFSRELCHATSEEVLFEHRLPTFEQVIKSNSKTTLEHDRVIAKLFIDTASEMKPEKNIDELEPMGSCSNITKEKLEQLMGVASKMKPETARKVRQAHQIADVALQHIRDRAATYDQADGERSAGKTAIAFNAITGKDLTESDVWLILQLLKDVRQWSKQEYHQDSAEDAIAYAALKAESLERNGK